MNRSNFSLARMGTDVVAEFEAFGLRIGFSFTLSSDIIACDKDVFDNWKLSADEYTIYWPNLRAFIDLRQPTFCGCDLRAKDFLMKMSDDEAKIVFENRKWFQDLYSALPKSKSQYLRAMW